MIVPKGPLSCFSTFVYRGSSPRRKSAAAITLTYPSGEEGGILLAQISFGAPVGRGGGGGPTLEIDTQE
jgi:hypothetical protein